MDCNRMSKLGITVHGCGRYMYGICEQTKCFPGMKKKTDAKFDIKSDNKTCRSIIFHSKLEQKHVVLASMLR